MSQCNLVLITFTGEDASGGVPRWVRDFKRGFPEAKSYCWQDVPGWQTSSFPEWDKAAVLANFLRWKEEVSKDDIIIVDGFWGKGWEDFPNVVSVGHGIWSHLIKEEADAGKEPDFPLHHTIQVDYRRRHLDRGGRLVAVSQFIQHQMDIQWGFESRVINNGIDLEEYKPSVEEHYFKRPFIIHGVNDKGNPVKGWDHIEYLKENVDAVIMSLDEASGHLDEEDKYDVLSMADLVVIPSAFEGNSYFALEALACDVPVVAYDVGLFWELSPFNYGNIHETESTGQLEPAGIPYSVGRIKSRKMRFPDRTHEAVLDLLEDDGMFPPWKTENRWLKRRPREVAKHFSIEKFHDQWRDYLRREFGYESPPKS